MATAHPQNSVYTFIYYTGGINCSFASDNLSSLRHNDCGFRQAIAVFHNMRFRKLNNEE